MNFAHQGLSKTLSKGNLGFGFGASSPQHPLLTESHEINRMRSYIPDKRAELASATQEDHSRTQSRRHRKQRLFGVTISSVNLARGQPGSSNSILPFYELLIKQGADLWQPGENASPILFALAIFHRR